MVLAPLFWLQSTNTLPERIERFMVAVTRSGVCFSNDCAICLATAAALLDVTARSRRA